MVQNRARIKPRCECGHNNVEQSGHKIGTIGQKRNCGEYLCRPATEVRSSSKTRSKGAESCLVPASNIICMTRSLAWRFVAEIARVYTSRVIRELA
jgi:hypothetical protein